MRVTITIDTSNAAFDGFNCGPEVRRMLRNLLNYSSSLCSQADMLDLHEHKLRDLNGNVAGEVLITDTKE